MPISALTSFGLLYFVCPERQANLCWKDSGEKYFEHTAKFIDGIHLSQVIFTKSTHCFLLLFASTLSSLMKGIRWTDVPFSKLASFEQPKTAHLSGMIPSPGAKRRLRAKGPRARVLISTGI